MSGGRYEKKNMSLAVSGHIGAMNKIKYKDVTGVAWNAALIMEQLGKVSRKGGI